MFVRVKKVGPYHYLQIAQNRREGKRVKQSIIPLGARLLHGVLPGIPAVRWLKSSD